MQAWIGGALKDTFLSPRGCDGYDAVEAGLESWNGHATSIVDASALREETVLGDFSLHDWANRDDEFVGPGMCGRWLSDTQWRTSINQPC
jgi:hypothetical protein